MQQDKLEKYVMDNREEFDLYEPGEGLWDKINRIESAKPAVVKLNWKTIAVRVAAAVVIFIASYFFHDMMQKGEADRAMAIGENENSVGMAGMENIQVLMEAEVFYTSQINYAKDEIIKLADNNQMLIKDINHDLVELDEVFKELKDDLKDNGDNEEVVEAMIQNYRIKLEILDEILIQLKKSKIVERNKNNRHDI